MAGLRDRLQAGAKKKQQEVKQQTTGATDQIAKQMASKGGKAVEAPTGLSTVAADVEQAKGEAAQDTIVNKLAQSAAEAGQKETALNVEKSKSDAEARVADRKMKADMEAKTNQLLNNLAVSDRELEDRYDAMEVEAANAALAIQDNKYIDNLKQAAAVEGLHDKKKHELLAKQHAIGKNKALLAEYLASEKRLGREAREFREHNLILNIEDADRLLAAEMEDELAATKVGAGAEFGKAGVKAYREEKA